MKMSVNFTNLERGSWTTEPVYTQHDGERLIVQAQEGSDFWEETFYGFCHRNGHALLAPWDGEQAVEVSFDLSSFTELYDQAGLMLWHGEHQWIKAGVEVNDGIVHVGAVVTDQFSDWSLSPVPEWGDESLPFVHRITRNPLSFVRVQMSILGVRFEWRDLLIQPISRQDRSFARLNGQALRLLLQDGPILHQMQTCIPIHQLAGKRRE